jgi:hypothetical protein
MRAWGSRTLNQPPDGRRTVGSQAGVDKPASGGVVVVDPVVVESARSLSASSRAWTAS